VPQGRGESSPALQCWLEKSFCDRDVKGRAKN
jgi:hypothetical protein